MRQVQAELPSPLPRIGRLLALGVVVTALALGGLWPAAIAVFVLGLVADRVYMHHQIERWKEGFAERNEEPDLSASQARVFRRLSLGVVGVLVLFIAILATWAIVIAVR